MAKTADKAGKEVTKTADKAVKDASSALGSLVGVTKKSDEKKEQLGEK